MIGRVTTLLSLALLCGPPVAEPHEQSEIYELREPAELHDSSFRQSAASLSSRYERRSRRSFIAASVLFGLVSVGEKVAAGSRPAARWASLAQSA